WLCSQCPVRRAQDLLVRLATDVVGPAGEEVEVDPLAGPIFRGLCEGVEVVFQDLQLVDRPPAPGLRRRHAAPLGVHYVKTQRMALRRRRQDRRAGCAYRTHLTVIPSAG